MLKNRVSDGLEIQPGTAGILSRGCLADTVSPLCSRV